MTDPRSLRDGEIDESRPLLSVVVPIFNEEEVIEALHSRLLQVLAPSVPGFEVVFVNDGSKDRSAGMLDAICKSDSRFKALHFSRNFGHQAAVTAGLHSVTGGVIVVIDADLQDPPELINEMLAKWRDGYDVVYALAHSTDYVGKGVAAGLSIVLLGILVDRVTRAAAERSGPGARANARRLWTLRRRATGW